MEKILAEALTTTNPWIFVILWISYLGYRVYVNISKSVALNKTLEMLDTTIKDLLDKTVEKLDNLSGR